MQTNMVWSIRASVPWTALLVAGLALLADRLFHNAPVGWTAGLFAVVLLATVLAMRVGRAVDWRGWLAGAMTLGQALALIDHPTALRLLLFAGGLLATVLLVTPGGRRGMTALIGAIWRFAGDGLMRTVYAPLLLAQAAGDRATATCATRPVSRLANWVLPGLAALVFGGLILGVNPVLERLFDRARDAISMMDLAAGRLAVIVLVAWAVWLLLTTPIRTVTPRGLCRPLRSQMSGAGGGPAGSASADAVPARRSLTAWACGPSAVLRGLAVCNCLFLVQTGTDLAFLWAGARLPADLTYAEYTHQGAALLMVMAILAGGFALLAGRTDAMTRPFADDATRPFADDATRPFADDATRPFADGATRQWIRRLVVLWLLQTLFVVASAIERLSLYIDAYMLTELRLAALIWMGLVVVGLLLVLVRSLIGRSIPWLVNANLLAILVMLYVIACVDTDRIIADYNVGSVDSQAVTGRFDLRYLMDLGRSASPALQRYVDAGKPVDRVSRKELAAFLHREKTALTDAQADWRGWTWRQQRLLTALTTNQPGRED